MSRTPAHIAKDHHHPRPYRATKRVSAQAYGAGWNTEIDKSKMGSMLQF